MATASTKAGFYGTQEETFYVTPAGKVWVVQSPDRDGVFAIPSLPVGPETGPRCIAPVSITPAEAVDWLTQIQEEGGEVLLND